MRLRCRIRNATRNGKRANADIEIGHDTAILVHLANIVARAGKPAFRFDPSTEQIVDVPKANALVTRTCRKGHWAVPNGA